MLSYQLIEGITDSLDFLTRVAIHMEEQQSKVDLGFQTLDVTKPHN